MLFVSYPAAAAQQAVSCSFRLRGAVIVERHAVSALKGGLLPSSLEELLTCMPIRSAPRLEPCALELQRLSEPSRSSRMSGLLLSESESRSISGALGRAARGNAVPPLQPGGAVADLAPPKGLSANGHLGSLIRNVYT